MTKTYKHNILVEGAIPLDSKYYNGDVYYTSISQVNSLIPIYSRYEGLTVNINGEEYWYSGGISNSNLVKKIFEVTLQIATDNGNTTTNDIIINNIPLSANESLGNIIFGTNKANIPYKLNILAFGIGAGYDNQSENNLFIGTYSGSHNVGENNIFIGDFSGVNNTGNYVTAIGIYAGNGNINNSVYLFGNVATANEDNQIVFSKSDGYMWRLNMNLFSNIDVTHSLPNSNGTLALSVNGITADNSGNISVPIIAASNTVTREIPSGIINGINDTFTLANTPITGTEHVYVNGILQDEGSGNDYTISGNTIIFEPGAIPQPAGINPSDDKIRVSYIK